MNENDIPYRKPIVSLSSIIFVAVSYIIFKTLIIPLLFGHWDEMFRDGFDIKYTASYVLPASGETGVASHSSSDELIHIPGFVLAVLAALATVPYARLAHDMVPDIWRTLSYLFMPKHREQLPPKQYVYNNQTNTGGTH